jgi:C-terminal processing protease CtpA/Prc
MARKRWLLITLIAALCLTASGVMAIGEEDTTPTPQPDATAEATAEATTVPNDDPPGEAIILHAEDGGTRNITGSLAYTNPFFTAGVSQPLIILEDQAGFVDRNERFLMSPESQVLAQITSNFYDSPFTYSLSLPIEPRAELRDVDHDGENETGVMVYAVAYWTNVFGDPYLEKRDLQGGGWSGAYASTVMSNDPKMRLEIIGGKYLIYSPDDEQSFPSDFGADGKLFTADDPIVNIPQGYMVVDLDASPFTFDRAEDAVLDLLEPESAALDDFSGMSYADAFDAMVDLFKREYAFTEYHNLDWDALREEYRPRFVAADTQSDPQKYALALRDFLWEIPDGHVGMDMSLLNDMFIEETAGGYGIAMRELDDGRVIVNFVLEGSPAAEAGIELGAEITAVDDVPIDEALNNTFVWAHQVLGSAEGTRLQELRYITRGPLEVEKKFTFKNPDGEEQTVSLMPIPERESFSYSSFNIGVTGSELPVTHEILPSGYGLIKVNSFFDDEYLTIALWERAIRELKAAEVPGIILDMRNNSGGSGFLADQMAAYFFNEEGIITGKGGAFNEVTGEFYFDPRGVDELYLPPEELRYLGPVAVMVGQACVSACEFFSYDLTYDNRALIVGQYPSGGLGGGVNDFLMPEGVSVRFTVGRELDVNGEVHIEGKGVAPTVKVPVTEETLFAEGDVILDYAEKALTEEIRGKIVDGGTLTSNTYPSTITVNGTLNTDEAIQYAVTLKAGSTVDLRVSDETGQLDTIMAIYDESGAQLLAENDDEDETTLNSAFTGLDVGDTDITILLEIRMVQGAEAGGDYTLTIDAYAAGAENRQ